MKPGSKLQGPIKSGRERLIQPLWLEALGVLIVSPLFAHFTATPVSDSLVVLVVLSVAMMGWSALFNTLFGLRAEARNTK